MKVADRIALGARFGFLIGAMLSVLALLAYLLGGQDVFRGLHTSLGVVIAADIGGGVLLGALVGALRPLAGSRVGAGVLGFVCGLLAGALIRVARDGLGPWTGGDWFVVLTFAAALGIPLGIIYREIFATPADGSTRESH